MKIDGIGIINKILIKYSLSLPREIIRMGYDSEADVFYAHFAANAEANDTEILAENENIILGFNEDERIVRITILNASEF